MRGRNSVSDDRKNSDRPPDKPHYNFRRSLSNATFARNGNPLMSSRLARLRRVLARFPKRALHIEQSDRQSKGTSTTRQGCEGRTRIEKPTSIKLVPAIKGRTRSDTQRIRRSCSGGTPWEQIGSVGLSCIPSRPAPAACRRCEWPTHRAAAQNRGMPL